MSWQAFDKIRCFSHNHSTIRYLVVAVVALYFVHIRRAEVPSRLGGPAGPRARWSGRTAAPSRPPGVRSHCRSRKRGTNSLSKYGMQRMNGGANKQHLLGGGTPPRLCESFMRRGRTAVALPRQCDRGRAPRRTTPQLSTTLDSGAR